MNVFVLIHSPLVGPFTWELVADALHRRGIEAIVPFLSNERTGSMPYWEHHVAAVKQALSGVPHDQPVNLVGHSGAGPLLPAVREGLTHHPAGYTFVDAALPQDSRSRLEMFTSPEEAASFRRRASDGLLPTWTENDLRGIIPDADRRRRFVMELHPTPLDVYEEHLPVFAGWPDAPCSYVCFSPIYASFLADARQQGWAWDEFEAQHFHMLVEPETVAEALLRVNRGEQN